MEKRYAVFGCNFFSMYSPALSQIGNRSVERETIFLDKKYTKLFKLFCLNVIFLCMILYVYIFVIILCKRFLAPEYVLSSLLQPRSNCTSLYSGPIVSG